MIYSATLNRVIDGSTFDLNVDLDDSEIEVARIRLSGMQSQNMFKQYRTGKKGADGVFAKFELLKWFADNNTDLTVEYETTDICGRWLAVVTASGNDESLNDFMIGKIYKNTAWGKTNQDIIVNDWFDGDVVTIPGGDELPIFQIWGKPQLIGGKATQLNVI